MNTALIVIDVQRGLIDDPYAPILNASELLITVNGLITKARNANRPIFFIQHTEGEGPLVVNTPGWQLHPDLQLKEDDVRFIKTTPDSFLHTPFLDLLRKHDVTHLILCGLQTEYCVDTTTRSAFSKGFDVTVVSDGHSTADSDLLSAAQIIAHHNRVLSAFASVMPAQHIAL